MALGKPTRLLMLAGLLSACVVGLWLWSRPEPVVVELHAVGRGLVERTVANTRAGTVKACRRARLAPQIGGQIAVLNVHEGDRVTAGDILLELWNVDLRAQVELTEARLAAAAARAEEVCLNAQEAARELARLRPLRSQGLISEERLDQSETEASARRAACRAAGAGLEVERGSQRVARAELDRTLLRAPFDGVVAEVNGELGEYVTPSPPGIPTLPAVDLIDYGCVYVSAPIDEVDAPLIRPGMEARVTLDAFGERLFPGRVRRIAPYVLDLEKQARTVEVEVELEGETPAAELLPGYSVDIEVILESHAGVLRIPTRALAEDESVLRLVSGVVEKWPVQVGSGNWRWTELRQGLDEGDRIILSLDVEGLVPGVEATASDSSAQD